MWIFVYVFVCLLLVAGFFEESALIRWEDKVWRKIKPRVLPVLKRTLDVLEGIAVLVFFILSLIGDKITHLIRRVARVIRREIQKHTGKRTRLVWVQPKGVYTIGTYRRMRS